MNTLYIYLVPNLHFDGDANKFDVARFWTSVRTSRVLVPSADLQIVKRACKSLPDFVWVHHRPISVHSLFPVVKLAHSNIDRCGIEASSCLGLMGMYHQLLGSTFRRKKLLTSPYIPDKATLAACIKPMNNASGLKRFLPFVVPFWANRSTHVFHSLRDPEPAMWESAGQTNMIPVATKKKVASHRPNHALHDNVPTAADTPGPVEYHALDFLENEKCKITG